MSDTANILGMNAPSPQPYTPPPPVYVPPQYNPPAAPQGNTGFQMIRDDDPLFPMNLTLPIGFYLSKQTPQDVVERVKNLMGSLLRARFSVRYKIVGEPTIDVPIVTALNEIHLTNTTIEIISPWKDFGIEYMPKSAHIVKASYSAKRVAASLISNWVTAKPAIKSFKGAEAQTVLGRSGASPAVALLTWSNDGAERVESLTDETKFNKFIYRVCQMTNVPIFNLRDSGAIERLERQLTHYPFVRE